MYWGTGSAAEFAAETAEFAHQIFGIDTELGEQARVFVGVDLVRQFFVGLVGLGLVTFGAGACP